MDLKQLEAMGAFISDAPVEKEIKFTLDDGVERTATILVRRMPLGAFERVYGPRDVKDAKHGRSARVISEAVLFGNERISAEKADLLHHSLANAIMSAVQEVNGGKKALPTPTGSSTT